MLVLYAAHGVLRLSIRVLMGDTPTAVLLGQDEEGLAAAT